MGEKAHPDVFNILLQILIDGRLTDAKKDGRLKNTVVIMTSNVGASTIRSKQALRRVFQMKKKTVRKMKENVLVIKEPSVEFLNRIDEIIVFHSLNMDL